MRHFADPQFVENFARLLIPPLVDPLPLIVRQQAQSLLRIRWVKRKGLQGCDEAIPSEERGKPRYPGGEIFLIGKATAQNSQVDQGAFHHTVYQQVVAPELGLIFQPRIKRFLERRSDAISIPLGMRWRVYRRSIRGFRYQQRDKNLLVLPRLKMNVKSGRSAPRVDRAG